MKIFGFEFWKRQTTFVSQRPVCADCGSREVEAHAFLSWDEGLQDWRICQVTDDGNCSGCGNTEVKIDWINP